MDVGRSIRTILVSGLVATLMSPRPATAQDDRPLGWSDVAEVTFVFTAGNASSSTFGLKNTAEHLWENAAFKLSFGAVRTGSGKITRTATGTTEDFTVTESTKTEVTAENYFIKSRLERTLGETAFVYGGADWDRNTFAGIQNRYGFVSGAGKAFLSEESKRFKVDLGLTYTIQDDVVENPEADDAFMGLRGSYDFFKALTETTDLTSVLVLDQNLNTTDDLRADWTNAIAVAMSERLALKASLQILYDKDPALTQVSLGDGTVLAPLDKVDSIFTVAIVANF